MMEKDAKIYVAGHRGMVGAAIVRELKRQGYWNVITRTHAELDLCRQEEVKNFFKDEKPEYAVITSWMFTNYPEYKFPVAVMNIPFSQNFDNILKIYLPPQKNNDSSIKRYLGIAERETEQYMCTLILMNSSVIFNTAPASMNSETYKSFLEELNKQ